MCSRGMFVHCPRCLGAEVAVLGAELLCGDGISAKWALEHAKALHHCDGVMPHSFKYRRLFQYDSELKLLPPFVTNESRCESGPSALTMVISLRTPERALRYCAKLFVNYRLILTRGKPGAAGIFLDGQQSRRRTRLRRTSRLVAPDCVPGR
jgi:hypothetical protein